MPSERLATIRDEFKATGEQLYTSYFDDLNYYCSTLLVEQVKTLRGKWYPTPARPP